MRISLERLAISIAIVAATVASLYITVNTVSNTLNAAIERRVIACGVYGRCPVGAQLENATCTLEMVFGNETVSAVVPCVEYRHALGKGVVCGHLVKEGGVVKLYVFEVCGGGSTGEVVFERVVCRGWFRVIACGRELYSEHIRNCTVVTVVIEVRCVR